LKKVIIIIIIEIKVYIKL